MRGAGFEPANPYGSGFLNLTSIYQVLKPAAFDLAWLPPLLDLNLRRVNLIFQVKDFILDLPI